MTGKVLFCALFIKTIERALCVFKDLQKRFKGPYVLFLGLANKNLAEFACKIALEKVIKHFRLNGFFA